MTELQRQALQDYALADQVGCALDRMQEKFLMKNGVTNERLADLQHKLASASAGAFADLLCAFGC